MDDPSDAQPDFVLPPYPKEVGDAVEKSSLNDFSISTDGIPYFQIDGKKYAARKVGPVSLRRFAARNDVKSSQPPYGSLRRGTQKLVVDELMYKIARRNNGEEDPWLTKTWKETQCKSSTSVNRYRLANVLFGESVRDVVLKRGQPLTKEDLDQRLTVDQTLYENIAREYNTLGLDQYDTLQFPQFQFSLLPSNLPDNFTEIHWTDVKKAWKDCMKEVERAISEKTMSGKNDPSDEDEEVSETIGSFTKYAYVEYWFCYAEQYPQFFKSMNTPLPEGAFNESSSPESSTSGGSKLRKASDAYLQMQEKQLHVQQAIASQQHEHHGRIIAIQEKNLATQADNQKSLQYRNAIAEKQLMALEKQQKTLESASRSEKICAFKKDVEATIRLLEQDVKTGMIDVKNLKKGAESFETNFCEAIYLSSPLETFSQWTLWSSDVFCYQFIDNPLSPS
jgi:hypothetical protein